MASLQSSCSTVPSTSCHLPNCRASNNGAVDQAHYLTSKQLLMTGYDALYVMAEMWDSEGGCCGGTVIKRAGPARLPSCPTNACLVAVVAHFMLVCNIHMELLAEKQACALIIIGRGLTTCCHD
jgi:hypothetical protein